MKLKINPNEHEHGRNSFLHQESEAPKRIFKYATIKVFIFNQNNLVIGII